MSAAFRFQGAPGLVALLATLALGVHVFAQTPAPTTFQGRSLAEALRILQSRGVRIVFTSTIVTPDMRVIKEPRTTTLRQQLEELLAPHGLEARVGAVGILQIVRAKVVDRRTRDQQPKDALSTPQVGAADAQPAARRHIEHVTVNGHQPNPSDAGVASEAHLDQAKWQRLHPALVDHPFRAIHALPSVAAIDDYQSEFAVRGSPARHVGIVVDGISTKWLQHVAQNRGATGSLAMLTGQVIEHATLRAGAYPRRHGDRIGAELELTLREGSRSRTTMRGMVGGTNATIVGEGPLGRGGRGSWLAAVRQSYLEWPSERVTSSRAVFGFSDAVAKAVYDVTSSQQVALSVLAGRAGFDGEDNFAPNQPGDGTNEAAVLNLAWRSMLDSSAVLNQRAYVAEQGFTNKRPSGSERDRGVNRELAYRADFTSDVRGGQLEGGVHIARTRVHLAVPVLDGVGGAQASEQALNPFAESSSLQAGYVHYAWSAMPTLTISPGLRFTRSSWLSNPALSRWILGEWAFQPSWTFKASAGTSHQLPDAQSLSTGVQWRATRPERATHVDVALERQLTSAIRWQTTVFRRNETDVWKEPDIHPRLVAGETIVPADPNHSNENGLRGSSWGVELLVDRRSTGGLSGWAAYSFGKTRYTDAQRHETFWGDVDQRHAVTLFGSYRFFDHTNLGVTYRAGSNFPIPGYLTSRDGALFIGSRRNDVRLPTYARLDVRADHHLQYLGRRVTLFAEVLNVLDRENLGLANGVILTTGEAVGFTDTLFRRRATAGLMVEF